LAISDIIRFIKGYFSWRGKSLSIRSPKKPGKLPKWLTPEEVGKLLKAAWHPMDKAMIMLAYSCALRPGELLGLRRWDIDLNASYITINRKGGKITRLRLESSVIDALKEWLSLDPPGDRVFPISFWGFRNRLNELCWEAKVRMITPHGLRHSRATELLSKGIPLPYIQRFLGHSKIDTTAVYLHITDPELEEKILPAFSGNF